MSQPDPVALETTEDVEKALLSHALSKARLTLVKASCADLVSTTTTECEHEQARLKMQLEEWLSRNPPTGKRRSHKLRTGSVGWRQDPARFRFVDHAAALRWAEEHHPEAIDRTPKVTATSMREAFESTGFLPDGCDLTTERDLLSIRTPKVAK